MSRVRGMVVLAAVLAAGCGGSSTPTSPGNTGNPGGVPPGGPAPSPGANTVTGSVVNVLDDAGAANVSFTVNNTLVGRSDASGAFSVGFPLEGFNATTLEAAGYVTRQTGIRAPASGAGLTLIPASPAFDLNAFNQMFRHTQVGSGGAALARWTTPPELVIERRVLQFTSTGATSYTALEEALTDAEVNAIIADMTDGYAILTAGRLGTFASVTTQLTAPGATVAVNHPGKIVVTRQADLTKETQKTGTGFWGFARWATSAGEVTRGFIMIDRDFERGTSPFKRSLRMHELGHTLGCQHVSTFGLSVMHQSAQTEPTTFDRQAARLAMQRPPGNRAPDVDPESHAAASLSVAQPLVWHGSH